MRIGRKDYIREGRVFHSISRLLNEWMRQQSRVKEESLTDWLLFNATKNSSRLLYREFTRPEESKNGADWEWWIITNDRTSLCPSINAYRFRVQAKKLRNDKDNYSGIGYSNSNGLQIELLIKGAKEQNAFPLYMFYAVSEPDIEEQKRLLPTWMPSFLIDQCSKCINGGFLADANSIYHLLFDMSRPTITDVMALNHSIKLSMLDYLFGRGNDDCDTILTEFNEEILRRESKIENLDGPGRDNSKNVRGIKHFGNGIPPYLACLIEHGENVPSWFDTEYSSEFPNVDGVVLFDARDRDYSNEYKHCEK